MSHVLTRAMRTSVEVTAHSICDEALELLDPITRYKLTREMLYAMATAVVKEATKPGTVAASKEDK